MRLKLCLVLALVLLLNGCVSFTRKEKDMLYELEQYGIDEPEEIVADPTDAALWALLPGGGNFYLGTRGDGYPRQRGLGVLNLITWPFSIVWAVPETMIDANRINKREMVRYFQVHPEGKSRLKQYRKDYEKEFKENASKDDSLRTRYHDDIE